MVNNQYNDRVTDSYELEIMKEITENSLARLRQCPVGSLYPAPVKMKKSKPILRSIKEGLESLF
jgi:hypothetical protein